jgi:phosphate transport system ATP-binding protein
MVFQKPTPFPMTIYDNIAFGIRLYEKLPKSEMDGRVEGAARAALWNEVKDKLNAKRPQPVRRPAAAAVHRAHRRGAARGDPVRRALLGARSDLDRQDRGTDRRAADDYTIAIVTHNMQQAARVSDFTAFMYLGELIEFDETNKMFTSPTIKRTQDYITGRFG